MQEGLYIAASAGNKQIRKLDVIANNLANVSTAGFKKDKLVFEAMMPPFEKTGEFETARNVLLPTAQNNSSVAYVGIADFATDHSNGSFVHTDNPLDLALQGKGFFSIQTPNGERYTRKGSFRLDPDNRLVTQNGNPVLDDTDNPIIIDAFGAQIVVDDGGNVSFGGALQTIPVGALKITEFRDTSKLIKEGDGQYRLSDPEAVKSRSEDSIVRQGFVENSNVSVMEELGDMVQTLRAFESYQNLIQTVDRMDNQAINTLGRSV